MKRWLGAMGAALWLWAGAAVAQAEDLALPGGIVMPLGEEVSVSPAETSLWGGMLAGQVRDALSEENLLRCIRSLGLYEDGDQEERLAKAAAAVFQGGRFDRLTAEDGSMGILLAVHADNDTRAELASLLKEAKRPDFRFSGDGESGRASAGGFSLTEAAPVKSGLSDGGVAYQWGTAALTFAGLWNVPLPFSALYALQETPQGETCFLFLSLPDGAETFRGPLEKGLAGAELTGEAAAASAEAPAEAATETAETEEDA